MRKWILAALFCVNVFAQANLADGKRIFESQCALCHGQIGGGGRGPSLQRAKLAHAPDDNALTRVISDGIPPEMPGAWQLNPREVQSVAAYVRSLGAMPAESLPGDPKRGEKVYQSKGCGGCHIVSGRGEGYGPELTIIGTRRNGAYLKQAVVRPAASIPEDFLYVEAVPQSGAAVKGIRVNEDEFTIQVKDSRGQFHSFEKSELKQLRRLRGETPMPSFEKSLSPSELDDLVAYLANLRGTP